MGKLFPIAKHLYTWIQPTLHTSMHFSPTTNVQIVLSKKLNNIISIFAVFFGYSLYKV